MKVKVVKPFSDKFNLSRLCQPGEVVNFEDKRAENIVSRGLGEFYKEEKPKAEPKVEEAPVVAPEAPVAEPEVAEQEAHEETPEAENAEETDAPKKRGRKPKKEAE